MEMFGMFFPWNASTLLVCGSRLFVPSGGGIWWCRYSCWRSLVVVIFVNRPATISMMSATGIALISYCGPMSLGSRHERRDDDRLCEKGLVPSSAKLWMCERLCTFMRGGELLVESAGERTSCGEALADESLEAVACGLT